MSKLNQKNRSSKGAASEVKSVARKAGLQVGISANGNVQFVKPAAQKLFEVVAMGLLGKDNSIMSSAQMLSDLRTAVKTVVEYDMLDYVANLAVYARTELNVRSFPIVLVVEFAKALSDQGKSYASLRRVVADVIQRADQVNDLYAYALERFGSKNKIPMAVRRGVGDAMNKFTEYQFGKYNRATGVKFRDILRITHPTPKSPDQATIFSKIMSDTLSIPYTWETELSANGQLPVGQRKDPAKIWSVLLASEKLGYEAMLKNIRNMVEAGVSSSTLEKYWADVIGNPTRAMKSRQLPFQIQAAADIVAGMRNAPRCISDALNLAIDYTSDSLPEIGKRVWIILDYSGSMGQGAGSAYSTSLMLGAALIRACKNHGSQLAVTPFGSAAMTIDSFNKDSVKNTIQLLNTYRRGSISGSTNFHEALLQYKHLPFKPDTIIVCTDGEVNGFPYSALKEVSEKKDVFKLTINMSNAATTPMIKENGWVTLSGWTPAIFKWIPAMRLAGDIVEMLSGPYGEPVDLLAMDTKPVHKRAEKVDAPSTVYGTYVSTMR
jgi:60 kDa SS-A/Ro ribonucleoprotein